MIKDKFKSRCQNCKHGTLFHHFFSCDGKSTYDMVNYSPCICKLYVPSENLEFVQWVQRNKEQEAMYQFALGALKW